jgi:peptidoglycan-N-acetylglucosamine deacetylase
MSSKPTLALLLAGLGACSRSPANGHLTPEGSAKAEADLSRATAHRAPAQGPVVPEVVAHGHRSEKRIALTFDACSTRDVNKYDARITAELLAARVPATIFLGGSWAKEEEAQVRMLGANPLFELGNHSYTHPHLTAVKDPARVREELVRTQDEIHALTGATPRLFRPPYGEYDHRLVQIAAEVGLTTVEYDLPSGDPDQHATKERLVEWVLGKAQAGSIVVMHINHRSFHTAEALPEIVAGLRARGFELVTVGELLRGVHGDEAPVARAP